MSKRVNNSGRSDASLASLTSRPPTPDPPYRPPLYFPHLPYHPYLHPAFLPHPPGLHHPPPPPYGYPPLPPPAPTRKPELPAVDEQQREFNPICRHPSREREPSPFRQDTPVKANFDEPFGGLSPIPPPSEEEEPPVVDLLDDSVLKPTVLVERCIPPKDESHDDSIIVDSVLIKPKNKKPPPKKKPRTADVFDDRWGRLESAMESRLGARRSCGLCEAPMKNVRKGQRVAWFYQHFLQHHATPSVTTICLNCKCTVPLISVRNHIVSHKRRKSGVASGFRLPDPEAALISLLPILCQVLPQ